MSSHLMRTALSLNALSCLGFGALFVALPVPVAAFVGEPPVLLIQVTGGALLLNGAHLGLAACRRRMIPAEVIWFSIGDYMWWLATLGLVASGLWLTTAQGIAASLMVAVMVAGLGTCQLFALGQMRTGLTGRGLWAILGQGWMAMKSWVKAWLTALNLIFLASLAFWPAPTATLPLLAYVAPGPLLLGMAAAQGGLTRALGLAHLVPFGALLFWAVPQAAQGGAEAMYLMVLAAAVVFCLALDLWDLARYAAGDRKPLGTR